MFWFDLVVLLLILGSMLIGFQQGVIRQGSNLFGLFFGLLVAATYQSRVSRAVSDLAGNSSMLIRQSLIFAILFLAVWGLVNLAVKFGFQQTLFRTGQTFDRLLGMLLGIINGVVWSLVLVLLLGFMTSVPWGQYDGLRQALASGLQASLLRPTILQILPLVGGVLKPFVPSGLPPIFYQNF
jgi:uncharacterized membrane protein required for colicin V production